MTSISQPAISDMTEAEVRAELDFHVQKHNFRRPARSAIDLNRPWMFGLPNYDKADLLYFRGRSMFHPEGSLEAIVEDAVKVWEMEASHLPFSAWQSVQHDVYTVSANGGKKFVGEQGALAGNYNWLMESVDKELYDADKETFDSSHHLFRGAFLDGFPWEVLKVFSPPPKVAFSWRHWAKFNGEYRGRDGDGKTYDMYGFGMLDLNEDLKVKEIEIFYKPEEFLKALEGKVDLRDLHAGQTVIGRGCPFLSSNGK